MKPNTDINIHLSEKDTLEGSGFLTDSIGSLSIRIGPRTTVYFGASWLDVPRAGVRGRTEMLEAGISSIDLLVEELQRLRQLGLHALLQEDGPPGPEPASPPSPDLIAAAKRHYPQTPPLSEGTYQVNIDGIAVALGARLELDPTHTNCTSQFLGKWNGFVKPWFTLPWASLIVGLIPELSWVGDRIRDDRDDPGFDWHPAVDDKGVVRWGIGAGAWTWASPATRRQQV